MKKKIKNIIILGSTGSIGENTLDVVAKYPDRFKIRALTAGSNDKLLSEQIKRVNPDIAVLADESKLSKLKDKVKRTKTKILSGEEQIIDIARDKKADLVVVAISGSKALLPLIAAIESKKDIALANKESLVMAGEIIMNKAKKNKVKIIPIDSEHSAIFQCLYGNHRGALAKIYITGSGGALDKVPKSKLNKVLPNKALSHPKWKMGQKITVDSATLMNKGLEVIEAMHLFGISPDNIEILIHPEAIVHSMIEFVDGTILAQLSITDMRVPIQYALGFPERLPSKLSKLDFFKIDSLTFKRPNFEKFPSLKLAYQAAKKGNTYPCALNAADEEVVNAFLRRKISLTDIPKIIRRILLQHRPIKNPKLSDILKVNDSAKKLTKELIEKVGG